MNTTNKREVVTKLGDENSAFGFGENFAEVMRLRKKPAKIKSEVTEKQWSFSWLPLWGNELYNKTVMNVNPKFEKL